MTIQEFKRNYLKNKNTKINMNGNEFVSICNRDFILKVNMPFKTNKKPLMK